MSSVLKFRKIATHTALSLSAAREITANIRIMNRVVVNLSAPVVIRHVVADLLQSFLHNATRPIQTPANQCGGRSTGCALHAIGQTDGTGVCVEWDGRVKLKITHSQVSHLDLVGTSLTLNTAMSFSYWLPGA